MVRKLQSLFIILFIPIAGLLFYAEKNDTTIKEIFFSSTPVMRIGDYPVFVEVFDTPELRKQGLSGRTDLGSLNGVLFIFDTPDYHGIWMKDMLFPIDLIWISEDLTVISITENLKPDSYPRIFEPPQRAKYVVETETEFADFLGITVGDKVILPSEYLR